PTVGQTGPELKRRSRIERPHNESNWREAWRYRGWVGGPCLLNRFSILEQKSLLRRQSVEINYVEQLLNGFSIVKELLGFFTTYRRELVRLLDSRGYTGGTTKTSLGPSFSPRKIRNNNGTASATM